jgi:Domain of unknown function (DUF4160)
MPTVLRLNGLRVTIYPNDHRPAHVHVIGAGLEAVFKLNCPYGPPELRESLGFSLKELNQLSLQLQTELTLLCKEWGRIHGDNY